MRELGRLEYTMSEEVLARAVRSLVPGFSSAPATPAERRALALVTFWFVVVVGISVFLLDAGLPWWAYVVPIAGLLVLGSSVALFGLAYLFGGGVSLFVAMMQRFMRFRLRRGWGRLLDTTICWRFYEDRFQTESVERLREVAWEDVTRIRILAEVWVVRVRKQGDLMIPAAALTPELEDLIGRKASAAGALVLDERKPQTRISAAASSAAR